MPYPSPYRSGTKTITNGVNKKNMKLYNIDLKNHDQNYACFSGWFLSGQNISSKQIEALIKHYSDEHDELSILNLDGEGEELNDYTEEFKYFDINRLNDDECLVILDLNYVEQYDPDVSIDNVVLTNDKGEIVKINSRGEMDYL